jgi:hypothetical protein
MLRLLLRELILEGLLSWWAKLDADDVTVAALWEPVVAQGGGDTLSISSSLKPSRNWGANVCTRACLRILLRTLKLRPQPSKGHVKAAL